MKKFFVFLIMILLVFTDACTKEKTNSLVFIEGGSYVSTDLKDTEKDNTVSDFYISKYEVTQKDWEAVMGGNPSGFKGESLPVETVSWYDCIEYCNERSKKENLEPYYTIDKEKKDPDNKSETDDMKWEITINEGANGYRLPTETEWDYAASGGQKSKSTTYSGSNKAEDVAWYWRNSGDKNLTGDWNWPAIENNRNRTRPVGEKKSNELGLYDMSGNVREWCFDWFEDSKYKSGLYRVWKGGGWIGDVSCCEPSYKGKFEANGKGPDQGFRVCRNK